MRLAAIPALLIATLAASVGAEVIEIPKQCFSVCEVWKKLDEEKRVEFLEEQADQTLKVYLTIDALQGLDTKCFRTQYVKNVGTVWTGGCEGLITEPFSDYLLGYTTAGQEDLIMRDCRIPQVN